MGKTGAGKGTQAHLVARELDYKLFSSGDTFRALKQEETFLGHRVREHYDTGKLFPIWFSVYLFEQALFGLDEKEGIVFEGLGRWLREAELFDEVAGWLGRDYVVVNLEISDEEAIQRQQSRGRDTLDTLEKIKTRLEQYHEHNEPAIDFFRSKGKVIEIDGGQSIEAVHRSVLDALKTYA